MRSCDILPQSDSRNLTGDGTFAYAYDAENRLVSATSAAETNGAIRVLNAYDHRNRRIRKTVQRLRSTIALPPSPPAGIHEWETQETHTFVWDANNIVLEKVVFANGTTRTFEYFWGADKSGTEQGAGGVGGLLYLTVEGTIYIPCYDNNGNITRYLDANGNTIAQYTYDAFGNIIGQSGTMAGFFRHRFSTKYCDSETALYYYGYRFYHSILMRWLNRDPLEEEGGLNLYSACDNNLINTWDLFGLWSATWASRGEKRRVYKKEKGDTIKGLADEIGMDEKPFHLWARIETTGKALEDKPGTPAPSSNDGIKEVCYISVPNVWIEADLLRGGGLYDRAIVNQGGTIGSFFGQTLGSVCPLNQKC